MSDDAKVGPGGFDIGNIMQMAQKLQGDVAKMQDDLAKMTCEAASGGGMVKAVVNGQYEVVSIAIEKDVVDPSDIEMLQDLIVAAINQAIAKIRETTQAEMAKVTGGLGINIPGLV